MSWVRINEPGWWVHGDDSACPDGPGIEPGIWVELPESIFRCTQGQPIVQDWRKPGAIQLEVIKPKDAP